MRHAPAIALLVTLFAVPPVEAADDRVPTFNRDIRGILSNNCYQCHGPDENKRKAKLRLDNVEGATAGLGKGRAAIMPGKPEASELLARVKSHDADVRMPPPKTKKPRISDKQIDTLRRWIESGAEYQPHWAFIAPKRPEPPAVKNGAWVKTPIDRFILARHEGAGITPAPEVDPHTLIRRLSLDLTGLLPAPGAVTSFVTDFGKNPDESVAKLVDALLANPHYGERWGRHWLDQARYADSHGYSIDGDRAMWPFRDWVIAVLNADMPFDQFTIEQVAGDLIPDATKPQRVASAFHRNTLINQEGGSDPEQFRNEAVVDRVNTTGAVWLGLTLECAQCHTHKFDPITHTDYYRMFAFFNQGTDRNNSGARIKIAEGEMFENHAAGEGATPAENEKKRATGDLMIMQDLPPDKQRETFIHLRGDFLNHDKKTGPLTPGVPAIFPNQPTPNPDNDTKHNRLALARWIVDPANPLTARVAVNRVWMRYFGNGLVETENDFGSQGTLPSHPDLLDWLAVEFMEKGWSMKKLHRLIVTSAVYRQRSHARPELAEIDSANTLLARQNRLRVEAEIVRDAALSASGLLHPKIGGPTVYPPQPEGVYAFTQSKKSWKTSEGPNRFRRAMYTQFYRSAPYPTLTTFDSPDFGTACTKRVRSNTPLQSLTMANDVAMNELANGLAARLERDVPESDHVDARIQRAWLICFSRPPSASESKAMQSFIADGATWREVARVLINTDEFITRE